MVYATVLAGGIGKRMMRSDLPKQFLPLGSKSIIVHTVLQFVINPRIERVYVPVPGDWLSYTEDLFRNESALGYGSGKVEIIEGGADRNLSLMAAVKRIEASFGLKADDILVSHDAVRPFVTQRIINENIAECLKSGAVDTVYTLADTPVVSIDGEHIHEIPVRSHLYLGQTPQTFNIKLLKEIYTSLNDDEKAIMTDACKMFVIKEKPVRIVMGESFNIKITSSFDYKMAIAMLEGSGNPN